MQLLAVAYKSRNLEINLESYPTFQQLKKVAFFTPLILSFCCS